MNKFTVSNMNKVIKEANNNDSPSVDIKFENGESLKIEFKKRLSIEDESKFIDRIVGFSFDKDTHEYLPEYGELGRWIAVLQFLSNVKIPSIDGKIDVDKCKKFINSLEVGSISEFISNTHVSDFEEYVNKLLEFADKKIEDIKKQKYALNINTVIASQTDLNNHFNTLIDKLVNFVDFAKNGIDDFTEKIKEASKNQNNNVSDLQK